MKNILRISMALILLLPLVGCKDKIKKKFKLNAPIYMSYDEFRKAPKFEAPRMINAHGNIYIKDHYLFITAPEEGIHFIDNSNPENPIRIGFLNIPGCTGMEINGNHLFVNSFIDLVVFDISSVSFPIEINRIEDVFPASLPSVHNNLPFDLVDKEMGVVVNWEVTTKKEDVGTASPTWNNCFNCEFTSQFDSFQSSGTSFGNANQNQGISGSITKFTLINGYLYIMEGWHLYPFHVANPEVVSSYEGVHIPREVETLFAYNNHIFMGTTTGMLIYNTLNPESPNYVSEVNHLTACDPVVVQGNYAYVTVRSGRTCGGNINQLDIIDVTDYQNPFIESSYSMTNPHGLGIDGNLLFICDGKDGLKVFDATVPGQAGDHLLQVYDDSDAIDIIPFQNNAIVIGKTSIKQYEYDGSKIVRLLSEIPITPYVL